MTKEMSIIVLGLWVAIVPYLGIPGSWRMLLLLLSGLAIAVIGFLLRGESLLRNHGSTEHTFVENDAETTAAYLAHDQKDGITSLN